MPGDGGPEFVFGFFLFSKRPSPEIKGPVISFPRAGGGGGRSPHLGVWPPAINASKAGTSTQHHAFTLIPT